jgi:hypothetical protein
VRFGVCVIYPAEETHLIGFAAPTRRRRPSSILVGQHRLWTLCVRRCLGQSRPRRLSLRSTGRVFSYLLCSEGYGNKAHPSRRVQWPPRSCAKSAGTFKAVFFIFVGATFRPCSASVQIRTTVHRYHPPITARLCRSLRHMSLSTPRQCNSISSRRTR